MSRGEVLVVILNSRADLDIARDRRWYRIPVDQAEKLKQRNHWHPKWLAFYQTKVFGEEAHAIHYYAEVTDIQEVSRSQLFPDAPQTAKSQKRYCKLSLLPLQKIQQPITSKRLRRITFIPTTWKKFEHAREINDLWDESPLEDQLWDELKRLDIPAERQQDVKVQERRYRLDFAIYCKKGKIAIETDGDTWHSKRTQISSDNLRDNDLETNGWLKLRFNTKHVREELTEYCLPTIVKTINRLGGLEQQGLILRSAQPIAKVEQLNLFDSQHKQGRDDNDYPKHDS